MLLHNWQDTTSQAPTGSYPLGANFDSHSFLNNYHCGGGQQAKMPSLNHVAPTGFNGANAPSAYQNLLQSMNNEANVEHQARNAASIRNVEHDILEDLYKMLNAQSTEQQQSEFADPAQGGFEPGGFPYSTQQLQQLSDNFDLSNFSGSNAVDSEAAAWFALQQRNNQAQANLFSDQLANATNHFNMDQLSMLPNQLHSQAPSNYGGMVSAQTNMAAYSGNDPTSLLTALLSEAVAPVDVNPGLLGDVSAAPHPTLAKAKISKKNASQKLSAKAAPLPFRALSAYNFFFRDERDRIINGGDCDFTDAKKQQLLSGHWFRDRTVKRRHRKTHGKIAFTTLSKVISQGWRDLPEPRKSFYREVAAEDLDRYQRELDQYKMLETEAREQ